MRQSERFETLDGLRGLAAFAVFVGHLAAVRHQTMAIYHGHLAVDFFFLLSGFVIGGAYEHRMREGLSPAGYMHIRWKRLFPMVVAGVVAGIASAYVQGVGFNIWIAAAAQLLFIPFVVRHDDAYPLNNVHWSLAFEALVNLAHVLVLRWLTTPVLAVIVVASGAALIAASHHYGTLSIGYNAENIWGGVPRVLFSFSAGILFWRLYSGQKLPKLPAPYILSVAVFIAAVVFPLQSGAIDAAIVIVVWPIVMLMALSAAVPARLSPLATWSGRISYPLYLVHLPLLQIAAEVIGPHPSGLFRAAGWVISAALIVLIAWLLEKYYETPVRRWMNGKRGAAFRA